MLKCDLHDYLEIASMFAIPVALTSATGERVEGVIADIFINEDRQECVRVVNQEQSSVVLTGHLTSMKALVNNTHFDHVSFQ